VVGAGELGLFNMLQRESESESDSGQRTKDKDELVVPVHTNTRSCSLSIIQYVSNMLDMYTDHAGAQLGAEMKFPNEGQGIHAYAQFYEKS